jgi:type IX secretion system PorP/SprF family membrane protein
MRKSIFFILIVTFFVIKHVKVYSQSLPMYSQYMYNMTNINPAYSGNRGVPSLAFIWRNQWAGMPGAPSSKSLTFDMPSESKKMGYGVQIFDDRYADVIKRTGLNLFYNIKVPVSERGVISVGIKGGFYNDSKMLTNVNLGQILAYDFAFASNINRIIPLLGAGVFYNDDHFYAGFSAPDVVNFTNSDSYKSVSILYQTNEQHYFFTTGYSFDINEDVSVKPSMLVKLTSGAPVQFDFNTNIWLKNIVGIGASYRTGESFLGMAEVQVSPQFRIGYAYDMTFNTPNTSELFLRLEFGQLFPNSKSYKIF